MSKCIQLIAELGLESRSFDFKALALPARAPQLPGGDPACKDNQRLQNGFQRAGTLREYRQAKGRTDCVDKAAMDSRIQVTEGQEPESRSRAGQGQGKTQEIIRAPFKTKIRLK